MKFNNSSSDYLTYKKSKMNPTRVQRVEKRIEKVRRVVKLSLITFCIMFLCVVIFIKKYAKRVDIEYGRHGAEISKNNTEDTSLGEKYFTETYDGEKRTIDKRLILIQEEENAPSESRVLPQDRDKNEVMNLEHFEKLRSNIDEIDIEAANEEAEQKTKPASNTQNSQNTQSTQTKAVQAGLKPQINNTGANTGGGELNVDVQGMYAPIELAPRANIKVLVGRYATFDEAKNAQINMKNIKKTTPFIRKVDNVYCLQIGSYTNMDVARSVAGGYGKDGFDVWIYQQ